MNHKIVYYVAVSLDGFIAGPNDDVSLFAGEGNGVDQYLSDLQNYKTVIMGRRTYEFGYQYGLKPGQPAYSHMDHYIFSNSLQFENQSANVHIVKPDLGRIEEIRQNSQTDVYLCGGGQFAGWLLDNQKIDRLKVKLNPIVLGGGIPLFGNAKTAARMELKESQSFEKGLQFLTYDIIKN